MAPVPALVAQSIPSAANRAIINIFAGIPATSPPSSTWIAYIAKQLYLSAPAARRSMI